MRASAGAVAAAPTETIKPSRMTIVPRSIVGPETGTMRALVIAYVPGMARSPSCAVAVVAIPPPLTVNSAESAVERVRRESMSESLRIRVGPTNDTPRWNGSLDRRVGSGKWGEATLRFAHDDG